MAATRHIFAFACLALYATTAWGQSAPASAPAPAAPSAATRPSGPQVEPVLEHIPAAAMGFVVVNDVAAAAGKIDQFISEIGARQWLDSGQGQGILGTIRAQGAWGERLGVRGGFAVVLLDANEFGVDLLEAIGATGGPREAASSPMSRVPYVLLVPAEGVKDLLGAYTRIDDGQFTEVKFASGTMTATQRGGYVLLGPSRLAVAAVAEAKDMAASRLTKQELETLSRADLTLHVNMDVARPTLDRWMRMMETEFNEDYLDSWCWMMSPLSPVVMWFGPQIPFLRQSLVEMDGLTLGGRLTPDGVAMDLLVSWKPGSALGKGLAAGAADDLGGKQFHRGDCPSDSLPDHNHSLGLWSAGYGGAEGVALKLRRLEALLGNPSLSKLPPAWHQAARKTGRELAEQVQGWQCVLGDGPPQGGLFSLALVMHCKDPAKTRLAVAEATGLLVEIAGQAAGMDEDEKLAFHCTPAAETIDDVSTDVMEITHSSLAGPEGELHKILHRLFGEKSIRLRLASPDEHTVVLTFGGCKPFMSSALAAARGSGQVLKSSGTATALQYMPAHFDTLMVLDAPNLYSLARRCLQSPVTTQPDISLKIDCDVPIAYGSEAVDNHRHGVLFVPSKLIKELLASRLKKLEAATAPAPKDAYFHGGHDF